MPKLSAHQQNARRHHILAAAESCFARTGFHGTTMQAICREAKISAGALYLYFDSKEALIAGIAEGEREMVLANFAAMNEESDFISGIESIMENCILRQSDARTALFLEIVAESMRNPAVRATLRRVDEAIRQAMVALFRRAKASGRIASSVSGDDLAAAMGVMVDGLLLRRSIDPQMDLRATANLLMQALRILASGKATPPRHLVKTPEPA